MIIHGREIGFLLTVGASCEIAEMCPNGDMKRLGELMNPDKLADVQKVNAQIIHIMNKGYEEAQEFEQEGYKANPITVREMMTLSPAQFNALAKEAFTAFTTGTQTTVEVEPDKKNETRA